MLRRHRQPTGRGGADDRTSRCRRRRAWAPAARMLAERLAEAGLDVVGIDAELVGGECPYWGCVPSKMMIRAPTCWPRAAGSPGWPVGAGSTPDWSLVAARIRDEATDDWDDTVAVKRFEDKGGRFVRGWGRLEGPGRVAVGDRVFEAGRAVIVGDRDEGLDPAGRRPGRTPRTGPTVRPSRRPEVPATLGVLGGGAIGVELAQVFSRFGSEVTVLEAGPSPGRPGGARGRVPAGRGVRGRGHRRPDRVDHRVGPPRRSTGSPWPSSRGEPVVVDRLLVAAGRRPDLVQLNVASIGLDESARALPVDDHLRVVGVEGVWAVGDVTGKGAFTHVSMYQADIVVNDILGQRGGPRRLPGGAPGHLHRSGDRIGRPHRTGCPPAGPAGAGGRGPDPVVDAGLDPQGRQPGVHQAGGGRGPRRAGRRHIGRAVGRGGAGPADAGGPRRGARPGRSGT